MKPLFSENGLTVYAEEQLSYPEQSSSVIVRCWGKNEKGLERLFRHLCDVSPFFHFDQLILAIDYNEDKGRTLSALANVFVPFKVTPVQVSGPAKMKNWTRLLNGSLAFLHRGGVREGKILNMSFDTVVDIPALRAIVPIMDGRPACCSSVRRTPTDLLYFGEAEFLRSLNSGIIRYFLHRLEDYIRDGLGHPETWSNYLKFLFRNTCMIWDFASLISIGGFDPSTNATGGQEELAAICALLRKNDFASDAVINSDAIMWYEDASMNSGDVFNHRLKMNNEEASILSILNRYRETPDIVPDFSF